MVPFLGRVMSRLPFLSIKNETYESLRRLRLKGENDDDLIMRIVELARCQMILLGMEDTEEATR